MLPASYRLRRRNDFDRVYRRGSARAGKAFVLYCKRGSGQAVRIGFSVSKKFGKAVQRNRIKRQLRHAVLEELESFRPGCDYVVVVRRAAAGLTYQQMREALAQLAAAFSDPEEARRG